jgi:hypothetical protein
MSCPTLNRRLPVYAAQGFREKLAAACAAPAALDPSSLIMFEVSTLYFETDAGGGFRELGSPKERRLEPQTHHGLLTDAAPAASDASRQMGRTAVRPAPITA